ncbi:MAG: hypothetical protein JWM56_132 [Candidatus Peribacteria bacterium]|nr:hypothetical protein [Candidatus Peribacteria bacterium]
MDASTKKNASSATLLGVLVVIALLILVFTIDSKRREAQKQLQQLTMKMDQSAGGNPQQNAAEAKKILDDVRKVYVLPEGVEPTVATIVKVEELRKLNAFYNKAKNGDNLIVTTDRAILFDPVTRKIVDVVPVQIQPPAAPAAATQVQAKVKATSSTAAVSSAAKPKQ